MKKRLVTASITVLVLAICVVYFLLVIQPGSAVGASALLLLYTICISFFYQRRLGLFVAGGSWIFIDLLLEPPVGKLTINLALGFLAIWFWVAVELGYYAGKYKRWKDEEVRKREIYSSTVAHELKTPITVMRVRIALLQKKDPVLAKILTREVERLQALITRMLDYSKISSGKYELAYTTFPLNDLLDEVSSNMQNVHAVINLRVTLTDEPVIIEADRVALEQIVINLLNNAIKHCPTKQINLILKRRNKHWVRIIVQDEGDGVPAAIKKKIFAPFIQGSNASPGLGMGLYIVRQLVDLHKGLVYFRSNKKGTTFTVELPINRKVKDIRGKYRI